MASHAQVHAGATWIGMVKSVNHEMDTIQILFGVVYTPARVATSTHISRAYFLGQVARVGDCLLGALS